MAHGRGATAPSLLSLGAEIPLPELAFVAPQAAGYTWYPYSFLEPLERNQPHLDSALAVLDSLVQQVEKLGKDPRQIFLLGFSQGACLVLEYTRRYPRRYGGVFGLSGGLIGPPGTRFEGDGSLAGTPIFLGCSDHDPHIPASRVRESSQALQAMGAGDGKTVRRPGPCRQRGRALPHQPDHPPGAPIGRWTKVGPGTDPAGLLLPPRNSPEAA